jgi:hypothetical protein
MLGLAAVHIADLVAPHTLVPAVHVTLALVVLIIQVLGVLRTAALVDLHMQAPVDPLTMAREALHTLDPVALATMDLADLVILVPAELANAALLYVNNGLTLICPGIR